MITLQIKLVELEAIRLGKKKIEWRFPSLFNKRLLLKVNPEGKFIENTEDKEILFINGYRKDAPRLRVEVTAIRPYKFVRNIDEPDNHFKANEGENSIGIHIGRVLE